METKNFDYYLPKNLIAHSPMEPRDHSKLLVINKKNKKYEDKHFFNIVDYFKKGDVLVWNNSKVFKARLHGKLQSNDGKDLRKETKPVEIFLVRPTENEGVWQILAKPGRRVKHGTRINFSKDFYCEVLIKKSDGTILVQFPYNENKVKTLANKYGEVPLPPYIKDEKHELETYQTVYAKTEGSVAAPTAGFHFTSQIIEKLKNKGVLFAEVTLHVGLGTFLPVKAEKIEDHTMHSEWVTLDKKNTNIILKAKKEKRRIIAVGTTTTRTLEGIAHLKGGLQEYSGDINIFITPGFKFKIIDALITNFHLPKSTLLMLVSAFIGDHETTQRVYEHAVKEKYRFFSFGDATFIH